jgi:MazG family protein
MKKSTKITADTAFNELISIMARLRGPNGCPWDKHQDHVSLLPHLFSEADEFKQAVQKEDWKNMEEELGDLLLQIVFHSRLAEESGRFSIVDVINGINQKLIRRHPHVFSTSKKLSTPEEVTQQWEEIKRQEKAAKKKK